MTKKVTVTDLIVHGMVGFGPGIVSVMWPMTRTVEEITDAHPGFVTLPTFHPSAPNHTAVVRFNTDYIVMIGREREVDPEELEPDPEPGPQDEQTAAAAMASTEATLH